MPHSDAPVACRDTANQLVVCMEQTPCVVAGGSISECLKRGEIEGCEALRKGYFECRRSQLDMRTRIRGRKFIDSANQDAPVLPQMPGLSGGAGAPSTPGKA